MYFYVLQVNFALMKLGIPPDTIRAEFKAGLMAAGKASGNSPQEVAVWIAGQLPLIYRMNCSPAPIREWVRKRKINPRSPEMRDAFDLLGWSDFAEY